MHVIKVELYEANDNVDSFAIRLPGDQGESMRARTGFGQNWRKVWAVDLETDDPADIEHCDWESVLGRVTEAYQMSDPVITGFDWPQRAA